MDEKLKKLMRKICSEAEIRSGRCACKIEARIAQTNLIPSESTSLSCSKRIV